MKQSDILRAESVGCCHDKKRLTCRGEELAQRRCGISLSPLLLHLQSNRTEVSVTHPRHLQSNRTEVSVTHPRHLQSNRTEVNNCHCNTLAPPNGDRDTITTATDNNIIDFQSGWSGLRWKCLTMAPGPQRQNNGTRTTTSKQWHQDNNVKTNQVKEETGGASENTAILYPGSNMRGKQDKQFTLKFNSAC